MSDKKEAELADQTEAEDKKLPTLEELEKELMELDNKSAGLGPELTEYFRKVAKEASDGFMSASEAKSKNVDGLMYVGYHGNYEVFVNSKIFEEDEAASRGEGLAIKNLFGFYHLLHKGKLNEALAILGYTYVNFSDYIFNNLEESQFLPKPLRDRVGTDTEDLNNLRLKLFHYMHLGARIAARDAINAKNKVLASEFIELAKKIDEKRKEYEKKKLVKIY